MPEALWRALEGATALRHSGRAAARRSVMMLMRMTVKLETGGEKEERENRSGGTWRWWVMAGCGFGKLAKLRG